MKLLSIGNSFSQDAQRWLHDVAELNGFELETVNLYIGGCSLETHWENVLHNNAFYDLEQNGISTGRKISIFDALHMENWDVITVQQVSQLSGIPESYEPYLENLAAYVREHCPNAKLYFHQTWAYEIDSDHGGFALYHNAQKEMFERIVDTTTQMAKCIDAEILPVGPAVQYIRETVPEFDYKNGGLSLCRDGFHLSFEYGRYIAAVTWLRVLSGKPVTVDHFADFDADKTEKIVAAVNSLFEKR